MKRIWKAKMACCMPWHDFKVGETCELDDKDVTPLVKSLFVCMTKDELDKEKAKKAELEDPEYKVKVDRLKNAKVKIPRNASRETIDRLFDENLGAQTPVVA